MEIRMKYDVTIQGTLECDDDIDVDTDDLGESLLEEIDNTDCDVDVDSDDDEGITVTFNFQSSGVTSITPSA
jgi:hypothetical protein